MKILILSIYGLAYRCYGNRRTSPYRVYFRTGLYGAARGEFDCELHPRKSSLKIINGAIGNGAPIHVVIFIFADIFRPRKTSKTKRRPLQKSGAHSLISVLLFTFLGPFLGRGVAAPAGLRKPRGPYAGMPPGRPYSVVHVNM